MVNPLRKLQQRPARPARPTIGLASGDAIPHAGISPARLLQQRAEIAFPAAIPAPDYGTKWAPVHRLAFAFAATGLLWAAIIGAAIRIF